MPSKSSKSSKTSSILSLDAPNTPDGRKSMDAIAKTVTKTDSRVDVYKNADPTDDPFTLGHHGGQHSGKRLWNVFDAVTTFDKRFNAPSNTKSN